MYIMSQDGHTIAKLDTLSVERPYDFVNHPTLTSYHIFHYVAGNGGSTMAVYPTEDAAKAQIVAVADAITHNIPLYCFDEA